MCFQAEDGIRDIGVTGVQTCALPIYGIRTIACGRIPRADKLKAIADVLRVDLNWFGLDPEDDAIDRAVEANQPELRSEERRVGKERRSRRSPYHQKQTLANSPVVN